MDVRIDALARSERTAAPSVARAVALAVIISAACVTAASAESPAPDDIARGKALYTEHCSHCHGPNMVTPGTVAFDLRRFPHDQKARFISSVTEGKNGRMPPWGDMLTPEEVEEIWAYVVSGGSK